MNKKPSQSKLSPEDKAVSEICSAIDDIIDEADAIKETAYGALDFTKTRLWSNLSEEICLALQPVIEAMRKVNKKFRKKYDLD